MMKPFSYFIRAAAILSFVSFGHAAVLTRVNMSAHIIESSVANLKDTQWTLYKSTSIAGGDANDNSNLISTKVQEFSGAIKSIVLPVGQYILKAQYGDATNVKIFKLEASTQNTFLNLKMVFNLGAIELSSSLGNSLEKITNDVKYVVRNIETGKIALETSDPSQTYYLVQGEYNVTAHFKDIVVTEAIVKILANNLNDVTIRHKVGEIIFNIDNIKSEITDIPATWRVVGAKNSINKQINTSVENAHLLLPAGDYQLMIEWGEFSYAREFGIHPGQIIEFKIPKQNG